MARVALVFHAHRRDATALGEVARGWLTADGHDVLDVDLDDDGADLASCDLAVSLGGDGTFLSLVPFAHRASVPVLGVNFGRLGYLLAVEPSQLQDALRAAVSGSLSIDARSVLSVSVAGEAEVISDRYGSGPYVALNEVAVEKTMPGHMVHLSTAIDDDPFLEYKADGVLVATATGSTAYNLSAGGPVLSPEMAAFVMTPVAPHLSVDASLVLGPTCTAVIGVQGDRSALLVLDGRAVAKLGPGARVSCRLHERRFSMYAFDQSKFTTRLKSAFSRGFE